MSNDSDSSSESSQSQIPSSTSDSDQNSSLEQLQKKAPEGEFVAYINPREAKMLKDAGGSGKLVNGIPSFTEDEADTGDVSNSGNSGSTSNSDGTDNEEPSGGGANTTTGGGYASNQDFSQSQPDYNFRDDEDGYGGGYSEDVANKANIDTSMDTSYEGGIDYNTADEEYQRVISDLAEQGGYGTGAVGFKGWTNNLRSNFLANPVGFMMGTQSLLGLGILGLNATPTVIGLKDRINEKFTGVFDDVGSIFDRPTNYDPTVFNTGGDSDGGNQSDFGGIISNEINTQLPDSVAGKYYAQQHGLLGKSVMDDYQKAKASINQTTRSAGSLQQVATTSNPFFDFLEANNLNRGIL